MEDSDMLNALLEVNDVGVVWGDPEPELQRIGRPKRSLLSLTALQYVQ